MKVTASSYIGVEQLDYDENAIRHPFVRNVIQGDTTGICTMKELAGRAAAISSHCELMPYNQAYMDKIQSAQSSEELVALWRDIAENSFLNWYVNPELPTEAVDDFIEIGKGEDGLEKQKKLLVELLDKNQLYVNFSEIDDADFEVSEEDKALNRAFYEE